MSVCRLSKLSVNCYFNDSLKLELDIQILWFCNGICTWTTADFKHNMVFHLVVALAILQPILWIIQTLAVWYKLHVGVGPWWSTIMATYVYLFIYFLALVHNGIPKPTNTQVHKIKQKQIWKQNMLKNLYMCLFKYKLFNIDANDFKWFLEVKHDLKQRQMIESKANENHHQVWLSLCVSYK